MADFRNISFGLLSAEAERSSDPDLILNGHVDYKSSTEEALFGHKYLFLGYKGAGKSSIGERLSLILEGRHDRFAKLVSLADFPFTPFSKIVGGDSEPESKYPTAWSWIILIYLLESFSKDEAIYHPDQASLLDAISAFRQMGLSPVSDPSSIVRTSSKHSFKISLPGKLAEYSWAGSDLRPASEIPDFVESLKSLVREVKSDNLHYLIIDGLDDILTTREVQYKSLSALIFEVARINADFKNNSVPAKIIILCRTDLFEIIPGANKNKIRHDYSVELDWYHDPQDPDNSLLVKAAQLRTTRSLGEGVSLFGDLLPLHVQSDSAQKSLMDMTRHTPRDFLQLLSHIQAFCQAERANYNSIVSGMREYSIKYFLPEIHDELSGYASSVEIDSIVEAIARIRKRDFSYSELTKSAKEIKNPIGQDRLFEITRALFNCSALGNIQNKKGGNTFYTFKYRNRHSSFDDREKIMMHKGLWKALNLV